MPFMIFYPSLLNRTIFTGYSWYGSPVLFGSNDIGLEQLTGQYASLGSPVLFWSNAV